MEKVVKWIEKRIANLSENKKMEESQPSRDLEVIKRIGGKLSGYKEVYKYIKSHINGNENK